MADDEVNLSLEQENCSIGLSDWLIQDVSLRADIAQASKIVKILGKIWLRYKKFLVPEGTGRLWKLFGLLPYDNDHYPTWCITIPPVLEHGGREAGPSE